MVSGEQAAQEPPPDSKDTDSYFEKLIKHIPADIAAAYVALENACFKCPPGGQPPGNANPPNTNTPNASPANTNTPNTSPPI